jgi:hypothetical protein
MPQIDFVATPDDEQRIVCRAFELGMETVPDLRYSSREILSIGNWAAFERVRLETSLFFLYSEETRAYPLPTVELPERGEYFIQQRYGGPYVMLLVYRPFEKDGQLVLPTSALSHYPTFFHPMTGVPFAPSSEFKALYQELVHEIKQGAEALAISCVDGSTRTYWVTPTANNALTQGATVGVESYGRS